RRERPIFSSSSTIRIRFISGQEHAKRSPAQFSFHRQDVSTEQQSAFSGDGKTKPHTTLLERDGRLEQGSPGLFAQACTRTVYFDGDFQIDRQCRRQNPATGTGGFRGVLEQVGQDAFDQIFICERVLVFSVKTHVVGDLRVPGAEERDPLL